MNHRPDPTATPEQGYPATAPVAYPVVGTTATPSMQATTPQGRSATAKDGPFRSSFTRPGAAGAERRRRGLGASGLMDLSRQLSERDVAVLDVIAQHRFLTTRQVQAFAFGEHASPVTAARICRRVLRRLEGHELITRPVRRVGGLEAGSRASVWMLAPMGQRLRNLRSGLGAVGRIREPGEGFVRHYLAIADVHLMLRAADRAGRFELLDVQIEPESWRRYRALDGGTDLLKPDLFAVVAGPLYESHWFIEVDRATESLPTVLKQCRLYETYRRTGTEQDDGGVFPRVLWVTPDATRAQKIQGAVLGARGIDRDLFRVAAMHDVLTVISRDLADDGDPENEGTS